MKHLSFLTEAFITSHFSSCLLGLLGGGGKAESLSKKKGKVSAFIWVLTQMSYSIEPSVDTQEVLTDYKT